MNTVYDVNLYIEILFNQVEDGMEYVDAGNHPKIPEQIVITGQQLVQETGMFTVDLKIWKRLAANYRTSIRFKQKFSLAHQELRENTAIWKGAFGHANSANRDAEITKAMANLVTATAVDRSTFTTLSATIERLTKQLATSNS